jgi:hypothetical protein
METGAKEIYNLFSGKGKAMIDEEIEESKNPGSTKNRSCLGRFCSIC